MEAGVKAVGHFFHRAVISAPLFPNLISCPIFKVAKKKKEERKGMLPAASESANSARGLLFPPTGGNSALGGRFQEED